MTVCIAAISSETPDNSDAYIVTIADTMISGATLAADMNTVKAEVFQEHWAAMIAGDDITQALPIIEKAREYFENRKNTLSVARAVFKRAFQRHISEMREDAVLGAYGMTMEDFLEHGRRRFTESKFESLCNDMERIQPPCQFLIHGYDD